MLGTRPRTSLRDAFLQQALGGLPQIACGRPIKKACGKSCWRKRRTGKLKVGRGWAQRMSALQLSAGLTPGWESNSCGLLPLLFRTSDDFHAQRCNLNSLHHFWSRRCSCKTPETSSYLGSLCTTCAQPFCSRLAHTCWHLLGPQAVYWLSWAIQQV